MRDKLSIVRGSPALPLFCQFTVNGEVIDLTGVTTPKFYMTPDDSDVRKIDGATAIIADGTYTVYGDGVDGTVTYTPADGVIIYPWTSGDLDTVGVYDCMFEVTKDGLALRCEGPTIRITRGA